MRYRAIAEPMKVDDEVPVGATIVCRGIIEVFTEENRLHNTYTALVYQYQEKQYAVYLDKSSKTFRAIPLE